ncbi:MAG: hypothetical protein KDI13_09915 [Alphaproteobacteria bacterium]|nr:hypothetical protein [Alphaproteobacteria bacterium]
MESSAQTAQSADTQKRKERSLQTATDPYVCFKVMGGDNRFNQLIRNAFRETHFIYLVREPAGICESYQRRGLPENKAANMYAATLQRMQEDFTQNPGGQWISFEDMAKDIGKVSEDLYKNLNLTPPEDSLYLYKQKAYGAGNEKASSAHSTKVLLSLDEYKKTVNYEPPENYISKIPADYWEKYKSIVDQKCKGIKAYKA